MCADPDLDPNLDPDLDPNLDPPNKKQTDSEKIRIRICNPVYGSKDPAPCQNVTVPEHWF